MALVAFTNRENTRCCLSFVQLFPRWSLTSRWCFIFLSSQDLVDTDVFLEAKKVIDSLKKKEVGPALAWCAENKSRLKKAKVVCVLHVFSTFVLFL